MLLTVATVVDEDFQVTNWVRSRELPSLRCPVAVNCCVKRTGMLGLLGETEIEVSVTWADVAVAESNSRVRATEKITKGFTKIDVTAEILALLGFIFSPKNCTRWRQPFICTIGPVSDTPGCARVPRKALSARNVQLNASCRGSAFYFRSTM